MTNKNHSHLFLTSALDPLSPPPWIGHVRAEPNLGVVPDERDKEPLVREFRDLLDRFPQMALGPQGVDLDLSASKTLAKYFRRVTLRAERRSTEAARIAVDENAGWGPPR
jgi:hypothetical protein